MNRNRWTSGAFFASVLGRRLQKQISSFVSRLPLETKETLLLGPSFPFLTAIEQNSLEIIAEHEETNNSAVLILPYKTACADIVLASVLPDSLSEMPALIKEIQRVLKPNGQLLLLFKNKAGRWPLPIENMIEFIPATVQKEIESAGFLIPRKTGLLHIPAAGKTFAILDTILSFLHSKRGCFFLFSAQKQPLVFQTSKTYKSTRITKASVLTSPRT